MPLAEEIVKAVDDFSRQKKQNELALFLIEKLKIGEASPEDVLEYARKFCWGEQSNANYVINADSINKLGVAVGQLTLQENKEWSGKFYELSAKRESHWGNRNYAHSLLFGGGGVKKSPKEALAYAKKAVELCDDPNKDTHKLILCRALREHQEWVEANTALAEYLSFNFTEHYQAGTKAKEGIQKKIDEAIKLLKEIIEEFEADFATEDQESEGNRPDEARCRSSLKEIEPLIGMSHSKDAAFLELQQHLYFMKGRYHEELGEFSEAWGAYCKVDNKKAGFYRAVIEARAGLLKSEVRRQLAVVPAAEKVPAQADAMVLDEVAAIAPEKAGDDEANDASDAEGGENADDESEESVDSAEESRPDFLLPGGIPLQTKFAKKWAHEATWFDSVGTTQLEQEYEQQEGKLKVLISAKKAELALLEEFLEGQEDSVEWTQKQTALTADLDNLKEVLRSLEKKYENYRPSFRKPFRRHAAETCFFKPSRSSKKDRLAELANAIIDQRFDVTGEDDPVILEGVSGRLLITAERVFQEAVVALSGENTPMLGIPVERESPWRISYHSGKNLYGPHEHYTIGSTMTKAEHRVDPKRQRLGDSYLPEHGSYSGSIYPFIARFASEERHKEQQLASWMLRYGKTHQPVTLEELQTINLEADLDDVHGFNRICFLVMTKEQSQWHSATRESFQIGMTVAFARCLIMIEAGFIAFKDVLKNTAIFSIYSHKKLADGLYEVKESSGYVDKMYLAYLQQTHGADHVSFFRRHVKRPSLPECVLTRKQAHHDLQRVYGGDSDTDGTGYETDLSM